MTIQDKVIQLLKLRSQIDVAKKSIEPLQAQRDELQKEIVVQMKKQGYSSVKTDEATIARQVSKRLVIQDENVLVADLKKRGFTDYIKERVVSDIWQPFAREAVKQNIKFNGTEIVENEYISVRRVKGGGQSE